MKTRSKVLLLSPWIALAAYGQNLNNIVSFPTTDYDAVHIVGALTNAAAPVVPSGQPLKRLGHLESGVWSNGYATWSSLGRPIASPMAGTPNSANLYGLTVNEESDRAIFGMKYIGANRSDGIIAWGDDDIAGGPDHFVFEFHKAGFAPITATSLMPDGNGGVSMGIGIYNPTEQLHTTRGVRFTGLTYATTPDLVGIDANGKLWRTSMPAPAAALGNLCGAAPNPLVSSYEVPMSNFDFYFTNDNPFRNKVNVGIPCTNVMPGKFNAYTAVPGDPNGTGDSYSIYALNNNVVPNSNNTGVYGSADNFGLPGANNTTQAGVWGYANSEGKSMGVYGQAGWGGQKGAYGGYFESVISSITNYGVFAQAFNGSRNYAVYATVGGVANGGGGPNYAGYFDGDVVSTTAVYPSDKRLKKNIRSMENSLAIIKKLNPVTYNFDAETHKDLSLPVSNQFGFISQEIQEILPELTQKAVHPAKYDTEGKEVYAEKEFLALNYNGFIAILAKGMQEQQQLIEDQNKRIEKLEQLLNSKTGNSEMAPAEVKISTITLSDKHTIVLNQNVPNPFAESTVISYNIPADFNKAQILFTTNEGKVIRVVDIKEKGEGRLTIFANDLSHGVYTYTLVVDGKTIETKKMIKE